MEAVARLRNLRGSARKARLVLDLIRGKNVAEAQKILAFSKKSMSAPIGKLLDSALANAQVKDAKQQANEMVISATFADDGPIMKRYRPRAQGRATVIRKRTCHITIEITDGKENVDGSED